MELSFRTQRLRTLCEEHSAAVRAIGEPAADVLRTRIADLRAATYLSDLPAGRPAVIEGNRPQLQFELRAGRSLLMVVGAGNQRVPRTDEGGLDQTRVRRALVQDIS